MQYSYSINKCCMSTAFFELSWKDSHAYITIVTKWLYSWTLDGYGSSTLQKTLVWLLQLQFDKKFAQLQVSQVGGCLPADQDALQTHITQ